MFGGSQPFVFLHIKHSQAQILCKVHFINRYLSSRQQSGNL